jgi:hypothetical protein
MKPSGLDGKITMTRAEWPTQNDFFQGLQFSIQNLGVNWNGHTKAVIGGVSNSNGIVASYWFIVNPGFNGQTSFGFNEENIEFSDPLGASQPYHIEYVPFNVTTMPILSGSAAQVSAISVNKTCPSFPVC